MIPLFYTDLEEKEKKKDINSIQKGLKTIIETPVTKKKEELKVLSKKEPELSKVKTRFKEIFKSHKDKEKQLKPDLIVKPNIIAPARPSEQKPVLNSATPNIPLSSSLESKPFMLKPPEMPVKKSKFSFFKKPKSDVSEQKIGQRTSDFKSSLQQSKSDKSALEPEQSFSKPYEKLTERPEEKKSSRLSFFKSKPKPEKPAFSELRVSQPLDEQSSRAKQMISIMKKTSSETAKPAAFKESQKKVSSSKGKSFQLRGFLYRKLKNEKPVRISNTRAAKSLLAFKQTDYPKFTIFNSKNLFSIGSVDTARTQGMIYPLIKPYSYANIKWSISDNSLVYDVMQPDLSNEEKEILQKLKEGLIQVINVSFDDIRKHDKMLDFLEENVRNLLKEFDMTLSDQSYIKVMYYIYRDFIGLNEIEPFLSDPFIEDIGCDGTAVPIYVVHQRYGSLRTNVAFNDEKSLRDFVTKLAERCDRYISYAEPLLDGSLPGGTRVHASYAGDVTTKGPTFSIRKFKEVPFTPVDMIRLNTASPEMLAYLWFIVENGANILIAGGVATGKTSILNCLSLFIPEEMKIVSIEDTRELSLPHENWIPGVSRAGFTGTGVGEVSMFQLLRESFRQNPDYLIVGEIRGKEAYVLFQSMASGHPSLATMHAGSVDDVMKRLQTKPIELSPGLLDSLDVVIIMVHAREKGKSSRRIKELIEIESVDSDTGRPRYSKAFSWLPSVDSFEYRGSSWLLNKISTEKGLSMSEIIKDISRRKKIINWLYEKNVIDIHEVVKYISLYNRNPEALFKTANIEL